MAAGLADGVIGKLTEMAVQQLANEAPLVVYFTDDFEWLCKKLTYVRGFLTYADGQSAQNELVGKWLQDVCDTAWDAEDIVEECTIYGNSPESFVGCHTRSLFRYRMGRRIRKVRGRLTTIMQDANELNLVSELCHSNEASSSTRNRGRERKKSSLLESGTRPVAIDRKIRHIVGLLDDPVVPVIVVVGTGGIGKIFLLQHVFSRAQKKVPKLQSDLASKIHVRDIGGNEVSEDGEPIISLRDVVKERVSEVRAAECIHSHLQRSRSLIVLDDVRRETIQDNLIANLGLPVSDNCHCKIVVTNRNREVCRNMNAHIYEMEYLSDEDSWKLFCAYAFANYPPKESLPHLEKIAGDIIKECGKLPLAIKTIAGSLAGKTLLLNPVLHIFLCFPKMKK
ncbi:probable disease resistance protein At1g58602 [Cryptomeria japonica]|uniref:probable disease resistance protein At1g58602 n=1 Tax=Cryptomeria japonica TaxID=3369 RepID=UPI0027DA0F57|nr:probable disease resistance protein At1g58602 [Cryptomeria japonica]